MYQAFTTTNAEEEDKAEVICDRRCIKLLSEVRGDIHEKE